MATDQLPSALPKNLWDLTPKTDEIMEELYTFRAEYAARFDYDLDRIHAGILRQKKLKSSASRQYSATETICQHRRLTTSAIHTAAPQSDPALKLEALVTAPK